MDYKQNEHLVSVEQHVVTLKDAQCKWDGSWENDCFEDERGVGTSEGVVSAVDLARAAGRLPMLIELHSSEPTSDDFDDYEGVLEASLHVPSRKLVIENGDECETVGSLPKVAGDAWRARVYYANGNSARYDSSDGGEHVRVALFPGAPGPVAVLKERVLVSDREYLGSRSEKELRSMLTGANVSHRCLATVALLQQGQLELVLAAASSPSAVRRVFASTVWLAGAPAEKAIVELAKDADPDIRTRAAQSAGLLKANALRPMLESLKQDSEHVVQAAAQAALDDLSRALEQ